MSRSRDSSASFPQFVEDHYTKIHTQLSNIAASTEADSIVDKDTAKTALTVVDRLKRQCFAPPEISFHGGDAVVMLWVLADTTYALTVTEGELGYVVRRNRKSVRMADSIAVEAFRLEDLR